MNELARSIEQFPPEIIQTRRKEQKNQKNKRK